MMRVAQGASLLPLGAPPPKRLLHELLTEQQPDHCLRVMDLTLLHHRQGLPPTDDQILNLLAWLACRLTGSQLLSQEQVHAFVEYPWRKVERV